MNVSTMEGPLPSDDYRRSIQLKERFVENHAGTSLWEVMAVAVLVPGLCSFVPLLVERCVLRPGPPGAPRGPPPWRLFALELVTWVWPHALCLTVLADSVGLIALCVLAVTLLRLLHALYSPGTCAYWSPSPGRELPFLTYFRATTFVMTALSILAVDLAVFPRRFAKTHAFGASPMDLGSGLFVACSALVPAPRGLRATLSEGTVFLSLGLLRYLCLQRVPYQAVVVEYGVHWNFFVTLGVLRPLGYAARRLSGWGAALGGVALAVTNQCLMSWCLEDYVLGDRPRDRWVAANREGLASLAGYLSIHLLSRSVARLLHTLRGARLVGALMSGAAASWALTLACDRRLTRVSRRLANLPYASWTLTVTLSGLACCVLAQALHPAPVPALAHSINRNGSLFFLAANLLTGGLNLSLDLYRLGALPGLLLLLAYVTLDCALVALLHLLDVRVRLKLGVS